MKNEESRMRAQYDKEVTLEKLRCATCGVWACSDEPGTKRYPPFCPMSTETVVLSKAEEAYLSQDELRDWALAAARTEAAGYCKEPRVEEIMNFARRIGARRLGIASCIGLIREARLLQEILEANGFEVESVCCQVGSIDKEKIGLRDEEKIRPGQYETLCNPVGQAMLLDKAGTELNIVVGLCVGHDSLFFKHSGAPVTVLVAKDRVTGHNPVAALYTSQSYYKRLRGQ
jgi:uncharacterized metal-binding protein